MSCKICGEGSILTIGLISKICGECNKLEQIKKEKVEKKPFSHTTKTFIIFLFSLPMNFFLLVLSFELDIHDLYEEEMMFLSFLSTTVITFTYYFKKTPSTNIISTKTANPKTTPITNPPKKTLDSHGSLSQDYQILIKFKTILYLLMIVNTGYTVYSSIQILDAQKALKQYGGGNVMNNTMLSIIIAYVISMFSLFCLTKIIDFLFDLDKKSNR